jgi:hypothetical protein
MALQARYYSRGRLVGTLTLAKNGLVIAGKQPNAAENDLYHRPSGLSDEAFLRSLDNQGNAYGWVELHDSDDPIKETPF